VPSAVKAAHNCLAYARSFDGIFGIDQPFGQRGKLGTAEFSLGVELIDKSYHPRLLFGGETFDFVDNLRRSHRGKLMRELQSIKRRCDSMSYGFCSAAFGTAVACQLTTCHLPSRFKNVPVFR
jgi:hypothetical protein